MNSRFVDGVMVFIIVFAAVLLVLMAGILVFGVLTYGPYWLIAGEA